LHICMGMPRRGKAWVVGMRTWEGMRIWEARMGLYEDVVFYMGKVGRYPICANGI
jgi:hypothetical protein